MALKTAGTNLTTSLQGVIYDSNTAVTGFTEADFATLRANIKNDQQNTNPIWPDAFHMGQLFVPNRGVLKLLPGDYVLFDSFGWPILVSGKSIAAAGTSWTHS